MMESKKKIFLKLREMNGYLNELEEIFPDKEKEYLQNLTLRRACEKTVELAIETVIDIAAIMVSAKKLGFPDSEDSIIDLLSENKILSKKVTAKVKEMKGFRNILIHKYGEVDNKLAYQHIKGGLGDFHLFEKDITSYFNKVNYK